MISVQRQLQHQIDEIRQDFESLRGMTLGNSDDIKGLMPLKVESKRLAHLVSTLEQEKASMENLKKMNRTIAEDYVHNMSLLKLRKSLDDRHTEMVKRMSDLSKKVHSSVQESQENNDTSSSKL